MMPIKLMVKIDLMQLPEAYDFVLRDRGKLYFDSNITGTFNYIDTIYDKEHEITLGVFSNNCDEMMGELCIRIRRTNIDVLCTGNIEVSYSTSIENESHIEIQSAVETKEIKGYTKLEARIKGGSKEVIVIEIV